MRKTRAESIADVDMTPMLDIVFILLIFFIVTTSFVKEDAVDLNTLSRSSTPSKETSPVLLMQMNELGEVSFEGRMISISQVAANVEVWRVDKEKPSVVIQVAENVSTAHLMAVTDQVRQARIEQIKVSPLH